MARTGPKTCRPSLLNFDLTIRYIEGPLVSPFQYSCIFTVGMLIIISKSKFVLVRNSFRIVEYRRRAYEVWLEIFSP